MNKNEYGANSEYYDASYYVTLSQFFFLFCFLQTLSPNTFISKHPEFKLFACGDKKKCFKRIQSKVNQNWSCKCLYFNLQNFRCELRRPNKARELITVLLHQPITAAPGKPVTRTKSNYIPRFVKQSFVFFFVSPAVVFVARRTRNISRYAET
jgi:hypothetical protein